MKKTFYFALGVIFTLTLATMPKNLNEPCTPKKNSAEVEYIQGFYVFTDSKPLKEFTYLGTVKAAIGISGQYEPVRNRLLKKGRDEFKEGDGIILHFVNGGIDKADIIKFKE